MCSNGRVDGGEIARSFGLGAKAKLSEGPVARGKQGEVLRLDTADGSWAVKVPFSPCTEEQAQAATLFHEAAHAAAVPTPRVMRTLQGDVFATISGTQVRVYEWVDLLPSTTRLDPEAVGSMVAAMHRTGSALPGPIDDWYCAPIGADRWDELAGLLAQAGAPFAGRLAELRDELVALETWLEPAENVTMCHRDLWADNVLPTAQGGVCVIDWENSGPADPAHELACVLFEFARDDPGRARALYGAYRDGGGPATLARRGHFTMLIAELGHITEIAAMDWLQPNARSPRRSGSAAWIGEVFDEPHTRRLLDGLLHAVAG